MAQKPSIPKGTRDFSPTEMVRRNYIFDTIRKVYQRYGYLPIETPAMENLSTLMGKYGEEGDKLLFKILNSGDFLSKTTDDELVKTSSAKLTPQISEKGLRYDLTVPFARYVVQHRNDITFPFRRYQIQPVWRADRPQKGRYREFYQCDGDVIGSNSLLNEAELLHIIDEVFSTLGIQVKILLNNRKILSGIAEIIGEHDKIIDITVAIDKMDKIGLEKVNEELRDKGVSEEAINQLQPILMLSGTNSEKLQHLKTILATSETGIKGIEEIETIFNYIDKTPVTCELDLDLTLARGLNYYTGAIIEVKAQEVQMGSICGGGRYDDLTGIFGLKDVSGVGVSFGADRIYDVLNELELFPTATSETTRLIFVNFGPEEEMHCLMLAQTLRKRGVNTEIYPEAAKMKKQMNYANSRNIPYVAMVGSEEMNSGTIKLKNMVTGEQSIVTANDILEIL